MSVSMLSTFIKPLHPLGRRFVPVGAAITLRLSPVWAPVGSTR